MDHTVVRTPERHPEPGAEPGTGHGAKTGIMHGTDPGPERTAERTHVWIDKQSPEAFAAFRGLASAASATATEAGLDPKLVELVNVRVSQINGCPFCLDRHVRQARSLGETEQRLAVLPGWRATSLFSGKEQAALAIAEITATLPDDATHLREYAFARSHLSDDELSAVVWVAVAINASNRVSILSRHPVRPRQSSEGEKA
jgi:AhpD family alkylhydroperoxidase